MVAPEGASRQRGADAEESLRSPASPEADSRGWPPAPEAVRWAPGVPDSVSPAARGLAHPAALPGIGVLTERLAAALVHHEPGWRLPRQSALARRYNVSTAEIDAAVGELIDRHMVRRLADGQVYRASPAEYLICIEGLSGLGSYVDAMGGDLACRSRQVAWRAPPEDISWALRLAAGEQVCVAKFLWTAGGNTAALCTTYLPGSVAALAGVGVERGTPAELDLLQATEPGTAASVPDERRHAGVPGAVHIEMQAPPPAVARNLRLAAGQPALLVTVRFDDHRSAEPVALTIAVLRPDMFRVVLQSPRPPLPDGQGGKLSEAWTHAVEDWEP